MAICYSVYFVKVEIGKQDINLPRLNALPGTFNCVCCYILQVTVSS